MAGGRLAWSARVRSIKEVGAELADLYAQSELLPSSFPS